MDIKKSLANRIIDIYPGTLYGVVTKGNELITTSFNKELAEECAQDCTEGYSTYSCEKVECWVVSGITNIAKITGLTKEEIENWEIL